ncbi:nuclear transport factor 2 family protein [Gracilimonas mengyeensis]|uniref:SnoaL-like domain-containing protein n=1 Tax=Gracilimonas mengyeensis TaxID=1302730 RepID=A0A521AXQ4_9BACT|nr:nuclear transport factor 2 family protein [Gracilimonas mengyeensis]SMO39633.1 SnoaL-like domain-containing protein [Gracilimonas mengyeensis]
MKHQIYCLILTGLFLISIQGVTFSQDLPEASIDEIKSEILRAFDKSIEAGEKLDASAISATTNDYYQAGFIDNGLYYSSFDDLMVNFKRGISGLQSQRINVDTKKVTVLSSNKALLTADGDFSAKLADGRTITGRFAWTFVYALMDDEWKVIHSHMSNPRI